MVGAVRSEIEQFELQFKILCEGFKKIDRTSLFALCIQTMRDVDRRNDPVSEVIYPWEVLLLLKWGFVFCEARKEGEERSADEIGSTNIEIFRTLVVKVANLVRSSPIEFQGEACSPYKFLRLMCYQQFWLQTPVTFDRIVRSMILTCHLDEEEDLSDIEKLFQASENLHLVEFFELIFVLYVRRNHIRSGESGHLTSDHFNLVAAGYTPEVINRFLEIVAVTEEEVVAIAKKSFAQNPVHLQVFEKTPFIESPLVRYDPQPFQDSPQSRVYFEMAPSLLDDLVLTYPVVKLKSMLNDRQKFTNVFGYHFERYLEKGLKHWGKHYLTEPDIKSTLQRTKADSFKTVDFLVLDDSCTILIEAKSNLPHGEAKINLRAEVLSKRFNDDLVEGFKKIYSTASRLSSKNSRAENNIGYKLYGFIITYEELFLWDGRIAWDEFVGDAVNPYLDRERISSEVILPENIMILNVASFDKLVELLSRKRISMSQLQAKLRKQRKKLLRKSVEESKPLNRHKVSIPMRRLSLESLLDDFQPDLRNLPHVARAWSRLEQSVLRKISRE